MTTETDDERRLRIHQLWQEKLEADPWNGWRALLGGWKIEGVSVPVSPEHPFQGYFRSRNIDKTFSPVAYWYDNGELVCMRAGREVTDKDKVLRDWPYTSRHPISHAWYKLVADERKPWPDADAQLTSEALAKSAEPTPKTEAAKIGDNKPPDETPAIALRNKIDNAKLGMADYVKITSDEQAAKARSLKNRLTELSGEALKERTKLSRPHLDALEEIRSVWTPLVDDAAKAAKTVNNAEDAWATEKLRIQRAEEARVAAEIAEAARVTAENERAAADAETLGDIAGTQKPVPEVKPAAPVSAETTIRPGYGRAATPKTEWVVLDITNAAELFAFLTTPKMHSELKTKMIELAQRAKKAGLEPPGVSMEERAIVR